MKQFISVILLLITFSIGRAQSFIDPAYVYNPGYANKIAAYDSSGHLYIIGAGTEFPDTSGWYQPTNGGAADSNATDVQIGFANFTVIGKVLTVTGGITLTPGDTTKPLIITHISLPAGYSIRAFEANGPASGFSMPPPGKESASAVSGYTFSFSHGATFVGVYVAPGSILYNQQYNISYTISLALVNEF